MARRNRRGRGRNQGRGRGRGQAARRPGPAGSIQMMPPQQPPQTGGGLQAPGQGGWGLFGGGGQGGWGGSQVAPPPVQGPQNFGGPGHQGGGPGSGYGPDMSGLGPRQRQKYNKLFRNQGGNAAQAYLHKLGQRGVGPGGSIGMMPPNSYEPSVYPDLRPPIRDYMQGEEGVEDIQMGKQIQYGNAAYNTAFGGSSVSFDAQGNPVYTETLSPTQQEALDRGQWLNKRGQGIQSGLMDQYNPFQGPGQVGQFQPTSMPGVYDPSQQQGPGQFLDPTQQQGQFQQPQFGKGGVGSHGVANQMIGGFEQFRAGDPAAERQRVEEGVYDRLTARTNRDYDREFEQMQQRLHNKGIPLDPSDKRYRSELDALDEKYQAIKADARGQAIQMGEQSAAQQFGQKLAGHQQYVGDIGAFYGIGSSEQQQRFGQQLAGHQQRQADVGQQFGQAAQGYGLNLQGQGQGFQQQLAGWQQQQSDVGQRFGQGLATQQQRQADQQQQYGQMMGQHQQRQSDMQQFGNMGIGFQGFRGPGFQGPTPYELSNPTQVDLALRGHNLAKRGQQQDYRLGKQSLDIQRQQLAAQQAHWGAMQAAARSGGGGSSDGL